jgi:hypothetical protein
MPSWASAARLLAYATDRSGAWEVWLHEAGRPERPLLTRRDFPTETLYLMAPTLSPDGERLIVDRVEAIAARARLWMSAVAGGKPERLTNEEGVDEYAGSWSPDGLWYAYLTSAPEGGPKALKRVKTTGQATPETLLEALPAGSVSAPLWSPQGDWILVADGGMKLVSADGKITRPLGIEESACTFAHKEPLLYCVRDTRPVESHPVVKIDLHGNILDTITTLSRADAPDNGFVPGLGLSLDPDGTAATYSVARVTQSLFLLDGLDRIDWP